MKLQIGKYQLILMIIGATFIECPHKESEKSIGSSFEEFMDSLIIPSDVHAFSRNKPSTHAIPKDTTTLKRNFVKYLISADSCCLDNIYINWGNDTINRLMIIPTVRQFRSYFTPSLKFEADEYLILEHGCATDCWAVLFLPLNNSGSPVDVFDIVKYNPQNYTVVRMIEHYDARNEHEFLEAINVKTGKVKRIIFEFSGIASRQVGLINTCIITNDKIHLVAELYDKGLEKDVIEVLDLENDIK